MGNSAVGIVPSDIHEAIVTFPEYPLRKVAYESGDWASTNEPTRVDPDAAVINTEISDIGLLSNSVSFCIHVKLIAITKHHMKEDDADRDAERGFPAALQIVICHGQYDGQRKATIALGESEQAWGGKLWVLLPPSRYNGGCKWATVRPADLISGHLLSLRMILASG